MLMTWISHQNVAQHARSSLASTEMISAVTRFRRPINGDVKPKTIYYTPWNGRFFIRYNSYLLVFRHQYRSRDTDEEASVSCYGKSPQILRALLDECCIEYSKLVQGKTSLFEHQNSTWTRSVVSDIRPISTVILHERVKRELLKDIGGFLDQAARQWYSNRGIPYRRGYLLYGPPGTGKSSLSLTIAGHFILDIYILRLSDIAEDDLSALFAKLPSRCVLLLEDIDAVSSDRSRDTEKTDPRQNAAASQQNKSGRGNVSLSTLLNVIDGVASREGRVLIMTTNHIKRLDDALIRPGRVDLQVELGLADKKMMADLFCVVFKPMEGDVALPENDSLGDSNEIHDATRIQAEEDERVGRLANEFAAMVPELTFSPAEILSFLMGYRHSPGEVIINVERWMARIREQREETKNGA